MILVYVFDWPFDVHFYLQIEEIRLRLNVDVNVAPGSSSAPAPIESFPDMVS